MHYVRGEYDKALEYSSKALDIELATMGSDHPSAADTYNGMAALYYMKGEYAKALELYRHAYQILLNKYGPNHPDTITVDESIQNIVKKIAWKRCDGGNPNPLSWIM